MQIALGITRMVIVSLQVKEGCGEIKLILFCNMFVLREVVLYTGSELMASKTGC